MKLKKLLRKNLTPIRNVIVKQGNLDEVSYAAGDMKSLKPYLDLKIVFFEYKKNENDGLSLKVWL